MDRPTPFDFPHFRALIFAAFVTQDWDAVGNALQLMQSATGTSILGGNPSPAQVEKWARHLCGMAARDAKVVDETGDLPEHLQCNSPECGTHGPAVRARMARQRATAIQASAVAEGAEPTSPPRGRVRVIWGPPVPGIH